MTSDKYVIISANEEKVPKVCRTLCCILRQDDRGFHFGINAGVTGGARRSVSGTVLI
jgi:hypothetical protein